MPGWVKIEREILKHWIWEDEKYFHWWMTILLTVNHEAKKFPVRDELFICNSGESFRSVESWATLFGCSKKTVYRFFKLLLSDNMITTKTLGNGNRRKHLLTVVNWEKYQQKENGNDTKGKPETTPKGNRKRPTNKNDKEVYSSFEQFWNLYDKKIGKQKAENLWVKLPEDDKTAILIHIPLYKIASPDKQYRKNPETYLRNRSWEDELLEPTNGQNKNIQTQKILKINYDSPGH